MSFDLAKRQFDENFRLFGNADTQPEKFNLYAGLSNLAESLMSLEYEIEAIKREIRKQK